MTFNIRIDGYAPDNPALRRFLDENARALPLIKLKVPELAALPPPLEPEPIRRDIIDVASPQSVTVIRLGEKKRQWLRIIDEVLCAHRKILADHQFTRPMLWSPIRPRWLTAIRFEIWYRAYREVKWSYPQIGHASGDRDHTSIMHGVKQFEKRMGNG